MEIRFERVVSLRSAGIWGDLVFFGAKFIIERRRATETPIPDKYCFGPDRDIGNS